MEVENAWEFSKNPPKPCQPLNENILKYFSTAELPKGHEFLDMKASVNQEDLIHFVKTILGLINSQHDQFKPCSIQHNAITLPIVSAAFDIDHKCTYEWSPSIIGAVIKDIAKFPYLNSLLRSWCIESPPDHQSKLSP